MTTFSKDRRTHFEARAFRNHPLATARRGIRAAALLTTLVLILGDLAISSPAGAAGAAPVPVFPDNLLVFPDRDFVSIEGYAGRSGQIATVQVTRPGVGVIGSANGVVSGDDVAFEVNHPGGACWGDGTGLMVTPDIQPGDVVSIEFNGVAAGATTVQDIQASDAVQSVVDPKIVTVAGHIGSGTDPANAEQRIIEPALVDTAVGKRDVRAVPGPLTPSAQGGYSSALEFGPGNTFVATYVFDDPADALLAANASLGERAMAWEVADQDGNRQGVTIAEHGEVGGPGMGGCPNGPLNSGPPAPSNITATSVQGGSAVKLGWSPAVPIPGTTAIAGYRVTAVDQDSNSNGEQVEIGKRISNPNSAGTTIGGLNPSATYDIEVVSFNSTGTTTPPSHAIPVTDTTPPIVYATPAGGSYQEAQQVTLSANESGVDIYYTTDGEDPVEAGATTTTATHYSGPIDVTVNTTLKFAAFDVANNVAPSVTETYTISNWTPPAAPIVSAEPGADSGTATVAWTAPDAGGPGGTIAGYLVTVHITADLTNPINGLGATADGSVTSATINGLTPGTNYWFSVSAKNDLNSTYGPPSAPAGPVLAPGIVVTPTVANAGPDRTNVPRNSSVTLSSAGSSGPSNTTYTWTQIPTAPDTMVVPADRITLPLTSTSPQNVTFNLPSFAFPMTNRPLTFRLTAVTGTLTVTDEVVITPHNDSVGITSAKWKVGDFRVVGTTATAGGTVTVRLANGTVLGRGAVTPAAAPAVGGVYDVRVRTGRAAQSPKPTPIFVDSTLGGTAGPFAVTG